MLKPNQRWYIHWAPEVALLLVSYNHRMMELPPPVGVAAALAVLAGAYWLWERLDRRRVLARLKGEWARPLPRERDMDAIARYHVAQTGGADTGSVDERTWRDLDLDAVFAVLDRTRSSIGQQRLYHRLRSRASVAQIPAFESLVSTVAAVPMRERCQLALSRLRRAAGYDLFRLTQPGAIDLQWWHFVSPAVTILMMVAAVAHWWTGAVPVATLALLPVCFTLWALNARTRGRVIEPFRMLGPLLAVAALLQSVHRAGHSDITTSLLSDLGPLGRLGAIAGWLTRDATALDPISGTLIELLGFLFALDSVALLLGGLELRTHGPALGRLLASVGDIDAAMSIASFRDEMREWCRPVFTSPGSPAAVTHLRHPMLPNAVPNSVALGPPHGVLLTGSNMSGKSTLLRSLGVAVIMSQTVGTCLASSYSAPPLCVRSCMGRSDSLVEGRSYYLDEVQGIVALVHASASGGAHLFLLDELFRGTNSTERIAAAEAALVELTSTPVPHIVVAATHDTELASILSGTFATYHLADRTVNGDLVFEYRLAPGPSTSRNAIALLERHGAPPLLVARALARVRVSELERH